MQKLLSRSLRRKNATLSRCPDPAIDVDDPITSRTTADSDTKSAEAARKRDTLLQCADLNHKYSKPGHHSQESGRDALPNQRTNQVAATYSSLDDVSESEEMHLYTVRGTIYVDLVVNRKQLRMEVDTGAAVSIISESRQKATFPYNRQQCS